MSITIQRSEYIKWLGEKTESRKEEIQHLIERNCGVRKNHSKLLSAFNFLKENRP